MTGDFISPSLFHVAKRQGSIFKFPELDRFELEFFTYNEIVKEASPLSHDEGMNNEMDFIDQAEFYKFRRKGDAAS